MSITSLAPRNFKFDTPNTPENVGPGDYETRNCFSPTKKSRIPFGTTTRRELWNIPNGSEMVGPGSYESPDTRSSNCMANFQLESRRLYFIDQQNNPCPADHSPIKKWGKKRPRTGFNNHPRLESLSPPPPRPKHENPGPGSYETIPNQLDPEHASGFSYSKSPQREPARYNGIPGPGAYGKSLESASQPQSPVFKSRDKRNCFNNPIYDGTMANHVAWMPEVFEGRPFGSNIVRELDWNSPGLDSPGPANEHAQIPQKKFEKQHEPFGSDRIFYPESLNKNPGPGFYDKDEKPVIKSKSNLPSFNRAERPELWDVKITPSPGQYDKDINEKIERCVVVRTASPAFKDRSDRYGFMVDKQPNASPGNYYAEKQTKTNYGKFGRDQRFRADNFVGPLKINDSPSPASYSVETELTRKKIQGGAKSKGIRFDKGPKNTKVGPGKYGKVGCDLLKPSYNVKFDPDLKKKTELKRLYT